MPWTKLGRILAPTQLPAWGASHAAVPTALALDDDRVRVFWSARDVEGRSQGGFCDVRPAEHLSGARPQAVQVHPLPVLLPGPPGAFDDAGAMPCCAVPPESTPDGRLWLYYIGWNRSVAVPFRNAVGLATSSDQGRSFEKLPGPILDRSIHDPAFTASCCVRPGRGQPWRMWYLSCLGWDTIDGRLQHRYHIKYAESDDGIDWRRSGRTAIDFASAEEYALSRPCVVQADDALGAYEMYYSYRGSSYRIGYARSADGLVWQRHDAQAGIDVSPQGWDAGMIEYPEVFVCRGRRYLLYNGDGFGATGIGLAVWE